VDRRNFLESVACAVTATALPARTTAAEIPSVVKLVVPFAAGGQFDNAARILAEGLSLVTKRSVIIDNKPGAGGLIGSGEVARSKPDGSMLLFTTGGHTVLPILQKRMPYDARKAFTPITQVYRSAGFLLLVPADSPFKSVQELLQVAKAKPGTLSYGSAGTGNTTHLVGALFARAANLELVHVPYKGAAPIFNDMHSGLISMTFLGTSVAKPFVDSGRLRVLAISGDRRAADFPSVPSFAEIGLHGADIPAWGGIFGPAGMSSDVVDQLYKALLVASQRDAFSQEMKRVGAALTVTPPQEFKAYIESEFNRYQKILPPLGINME
jgi:tripartite-type tricarboxylate transporter receptor subunit TctC